MVFPLSDERMNTQQQQKQNDERKKETILQANEKKLKKREHVLRRQMNTHTNRADFCLTFKSLTQIIWEKFCFCLALPTTNSNLLIFFVKRCEIEVHTKKAKLMSKSPWSHVFEIFHTRSISEIEY